MLSVARHALHVYREWRLRDLGQERSRRRVAGEVAMKIDAHDRIDRAFCVGTDEHWLLALVQRTARAGDTVFDIDAHKGSGALHLARRVGPSGRAWAFERDPHARAQLERRGDRKGSCHLRVHEQALGVGTGAFGFTLAERPGWPSFCPDPEVRNVAFRPLRAIEEASGQGLDIVACKTASGRTAAPDPRSS